MLSAARSTPVPHGPRHGPPGSRGVWLRAASPVSPRPATSTDGARHPAGRMAAATRLLLPARLRGPGWLCFLVLPGGGAGSGSRAFSPRIARRPAVDNHPPTRHCHFFAGGHLTTGGSGHLEWLYGWLLPARHLLSPRALACLLEGRRPAGTGLWHTGGGFLPRGRLVAALILVAASRPTAGTISDVPGWDARLCPRRRQTPLARKP